MGLLGDIFTWWNGATIGTRLFSRRNGVEVGRDAFGNRYFRAKKGGRRWVLYEGSNDASRVSAEWHGWLHGTTDVAPTEHYVPPAPWVAPYRANATGTLEAHRPAGSLDAGGRRASATGDYEAWSPDS